MALLGRTARWRVYTGYAGRVAIAGEFSAKVFAEAEAQRLRDKYPDPIAEFWISSTDLRCTRTWASIEAFLSTVGKNADIFGRSSKKTADERVRSVVRQAIRDEIAGRRLDSSVSCLPYTICELMAHIAGQFRPRMAWANYGTEWVIDHIVPRAAFDMRDPAQLMQCWALSNLQPLWMQENGAKIASDKKIIRDMRAV